MYFGEPYETPGFVPATMSFDPAAAGRYEVAGPGWTFTVTTRDDRPVLVYSSTRQNSMIPLAGGGYLLPVDWSVLRFTKDEAGVVTGGTMTFPGNPSPLEFKRTK
jgi:hypothetical protein